MGRPKKPSDQATEQLAVRMPKTLLAALDAERLRQGQDRFGTVPDRSAVIREAVIAYLAGRTSTKR
jgi:hypothetical protein